MYSPYLVLDLQEGASDSDVEKSYASLTERLAPGSFKTDAAEEQAVRCLKAATDAYKKSR